jgi:hypothetical protein
MHASGRETGREQQYADAHGSDMIGFTYDEESYADPDLDAWVVELGGILRKRRAAPPAGDATPKTEAEPKSEADG